MCPTSSSPQEVDGIFQRILSETERQFGTRSQDDGGVYMQCYDSSSTLAFTAQLQFINPIAPREYP